MDESDRGNDSPPDERESVGEESEGRDLDLPGSVPVEAETLGFLTVDRLSPDGFTARQRTTFRRFAAIAAVALLLVAAAGGYMAYTHQTAPETETQRVTVATWEVEGGFEHGAVVENGTTVFEEGERLRNRPTYLTRLSPILEGTYVLEHGGDVEPATGSVDLELVVRAVSDDVVRWQSRETLATESIEGLQPGEAHRVSFELNSTAIAQRISDIENEPGSSLYSTEAVVVANATLETTAGEDRFVTDRVDQFQINPGGSTYGVSTSLDEPGSFTATETREVPVDRSPVPLYAGILLILVGLVGAGGVGLAYVNGLATVTPTERRRIRFEDARNDYDKWISRGAVPPDDDRETIELDTLEDLVNVAIDSDRRVIERVTPPLRYCVYVDDVRYVFEPPPGASLPDGTDRARTDRSHGDREDISEKVEPSVEGDWSFEEATDPERVDE